jgi:hypothetical protein
MSKEAMKLALEAAYLAGFNVSEEGYNGKYPFRDHDSHPEQDVCWMDERAAYIGRAMAKPDFWEGYVPEPVKPAQCKYPKCSYPCTDLPDCRDADQPAQRTWVGLTDEEVDEWTPEIHTVIRAIEAKLKEKNT